MPAIDVLIRYTDPCFRCLLAARLARELHGYTLVDLAAGPASSGVFR
ncbi:hypothetical protein [Peterkaempfera bronchialis]|nr:hypothetical protein [Peterkaempfera bronchialis]